MIKNFAAGTAAQPRGSSIPPHSTRVSTCRTVQDDDPIVAGWITADQDARSEVALLDTPMHPEAADVLPFIAVAAQNVVL